MNRHQRRKLARVKAEEKLLGLAQAERSRRIAETVKANKSAPIERNYYPQSVFAGFASRSHSGYVCHNIKGQDFLPKGSVARGFNRG